MLEIMRVMWYNTMGCDTMKTIDKAAWQIDGGVPAEKVVSHFRMMFEWLASHGMLTEDGEEELEDGIDDCAVLNDELVNGQGMAFLEKCYDDYLKAAADFYGNDDGGSALEDIYRKYCADT